MEIERDQETLENELPETVRHDLVEMALIWTPQLPKDPMEANTLLLYMGQFHKLATELRASHP